jgi:hypothetical protein
MITLSLALVLLQNHLLSWGSILCVYVQGDGIWEVEVTLINNFQCQMSRISKGAIWNVGDTRLNIQIIFFGPACVNFECSMKGF